MAGIIYEFMDGLRDEIALYDKLCEFAAEKRSHLIKGDIQKINETTIKEENAVTVMKGLERRRKQFMSDISSILNINPAEASLTKIEEALKNQPEEASALSEIKASLTKSIDRLKSMNNENLVLINQSLEYAQFSINILQSSIEGPALTSNYGNENEGRGKSFFDAKQ